MNATLFDTARVLEVQLRNVYGNEAAYPMNDAARIFAAIAGTKTLLPATLAHAKALGYSVTFVASKPSSRFADSAGALACASCDIPANVPHFHNTIGGRLVGTRA